LTGLVVAGPTATGKTELAAELAKRLGGEIVSADSRQVYKGFDVGTNKSRPAGVAIHLLDVATPDEPYSVGRYLEAAVPAIQEIRARRSHPILVGGTGLYIKAVLEGLSVLPQRDAATRERLEALSTTALREKLTAADPRAAQTIPEGNRQRMIRALEVFDLTGRPISEKWGERTGAAPGPWKAFVIDWPVEELKRRIVSRCLAMWPGLLDEVRALKKAWAGTEPAFESVGYREALSCIEGRCPESDSYAAFEKATLAYAKRQRTWFRNQLDAVVVRGGPLEDMTRQALKAL
jgi:tRNA dimethylallyltransferase